MLTEKSCGRKCEWIVTDDPDDCKMTTTTPPTTTSTPAGCCHGDLTSYKANEKCVGIDNQNSCERKSCNWLITDDPEDCVVTTTTTEPTTTESGCCKGTNFKSNEGCNAMLTERSCGRKCVWIPGGDLEDDCAMTTTSTPTGCCKGESYKSNLACNDLDMESKCIRSGKCSWIVDGDLDVECFMDATTPSPTEPAGCCYSGAYKDSDKCAKPMDREMCESKDCLWMVTDDPEDCVFTTTTTETPTTTSTPAGCCHGDLTSFKANEKCVGIDNEQ